jgi:hypothetical protein
MPIGDVAEHVGVEIAAEDGFGHGRRKLAVKSLG